MTECSLDQMPRPTSIDTLFFIDIVPIWNSLPADVIRNLSPMQVFQDQNSCSVLLTLPSAGMCSDDVNGLKRSRMYITAVYINCSDLKDSHGCLMNSNDN